MEFQQRLNELRRQAGLTQEGLADLLGVTRQAVQKWESGASRPDLENLAALARYFNVSLDYLVTGQESVSDGPEPVSVVNNYYTGWHYEYKSSRTIFGMPLVHIRLGNRGAGVARGFFAIGNVAVGVFALGGIAIGAITFGGMSLGLLLGLGGLAFGGIAVGGLAVGLLALGGSAVGLFAVGGAAYGMYAIGGGAWGSKVAIGGGAWGALAIGRESASGVITFLPGADLSAVEAAAREAAAGLPGFLRNILAVVAKSIL